MHPAFSVIFFTTASGAGYGLLGVLAVLAAWQVIPADRLSGIVGLGLAFVLVSGGLMSSTFHLGHPERAWRALTQWRSSWFVAGRCVGGIDLHPLAGAGLCVDHSRRYQWPCGALPLGYPWHWRRPRCMRRR